MHRLSSIQQEELELVLGGQGHEGARTRNSAQNQNRSSRHVNVFKPKHRQLSLVLLLYELPIHVHRIYGWWLPHVSYLSVHEEHPGKHSRIHHEGNIARLGCSSQAQTNS